ncbi:MAG: hypothetical protein KDD11_13710, partial [Acidobacteria bacterium]|nr:hypothetical protein [Acidobacteriota bacterium]
MKRLSWTCTLLAAVAAVTVTAPPSHAATPAQIAAEESGIETTTAAPSQLRDPSAHTQALNALPATGLLLVPESSNDRVMAFDPMTGDLIDADFVPSDMTNLSTPIHAILGSDGNSILISDQINDVVQQYDLDGNYLGIFAPAGGVDNSILDNIRGISLRPNGNLLVSVGGGANDDAIAEFDTSGAYVGNFVANGAGGLDSPFDIYRRAADWLSGGINSDMIHSYDDAGMSLGAFAPINTFPEQIAEAANGNVLVANFSGTQEGVVELSPDGTTVVGVYDPASLGGYRGVYELPNGNILTTNSSGVHEIDRSGNLVQTKISSVSAQYIEYVAPQVDCTSL